jgi:hypothetical protein
MDLRQAQRKQAKIKLALQGPSGSGKTYSALLLASGICDYSKIAVIDTENHSTDLYAHLGSYNVLQLSSPFTPERYIAAIGKNRLNLFCLIVNLTLPPAPWVAY